MRQLCAGRMTPHIQDMRRDGLLLPRSTPSRRHFPSRLQNLIRISYNRSYLDPPKTP